MSFKWKLGTVRSHHDELPTCNVVSLFCNDAAAAAAAQVRLTFR
jgi:hypothetical protein